MTLTWKIVGISAVVAVLMTIGTGAYAARRRPRATTLVVDGNTVVSVLRFPDGTREVVAAHGRETTAYSVSGDRTGYVVKPASGAPSFHMTVTSDRELARSIARLHN